MDDMIEPRRSSRPRRQHVLFKAFGKDLAAAKDGVAVKPARMDDDSNRPVADWQIRQTPAIPTMNPRGIGPASRALAGFASRPHRNHRADQLITYAFNNEPTRHQTRRSESLIKGVFRPFAMRP